MKKFKNVEELLLLSMKSGLFQEDFQDFLSWKMSGK